MFTDSLYNEIISLRLSRLTITYYGGKLMFCGNCGHQMPDGQRFCDNCGAPTDLSPSETMKQSDMPENTNDFDYRYESEETQVLGGQNVPQDIYGSEETQVLSDYNAPQPNASQPPYMPPQQAYTPQQPINNPQQPYNPQGYMPQYGYQPAQPQKKSKKPLVIGIIAAVVVLCVVLGALFLPKLFMSDKDRMHSLEKKAVHEALNTYKNAVEESGLQKGTVALDIEPGQYLADLAKNQGVDISWLKKAKITTTTDSKDNVNASRVRLSLNDTEVACLDLLTDSKTNTSLIGLDGLAPGYGKIDQNAIRTSITGLTGLTSIDNEKATALIEKYFAMAVDSIENVKKTSEEITAAGVTEKVTVYTAAISERQSLEIGKKVLTAALDDAEVKAFLEKAYPALSSMVGTGSSGFEEFYLNYQIRINDQLRDITEQLTGASDDAVMLLTEYVSHDKITGIKVSMPQEGSEYSAVLALKGTDFGAQVTVNGETVLTGTGSGNIFTASVNGDFRVYVNGSVYANIKLTDYNMKAFKGTVEISLTKDAWSNIVTDSSTAAMLSTASLKIDMAKEKSTLDAVVAGQSFVKASVTKSEPEKLSFDTNVDSVDASEWSQTINYSELMKRLVDAGVPASFVKSMFGSLYYIR